MPRPSATVSVHVKSVDEVAKVCQDLKQDSYRDLFKQNNNLLVNGYITHNNYVFNVIVSLTEKNCFSH